jgi:hypothetical protein
MDRESNFLDCKSRVTLVLKECDLWELVEKVFVRPTYPAFHKKEIKFERVVLDSMKDNLILHPLEKNMAKYIFDALVGLFQSTNMNRNNLSSNILRSV